MFDVSSKTDSDVQQLL